MLITDIMDVFEDDVTEEYTESKLKRYIARAVRYYSRYAARILTATLETIANQQELDLPSGCVLVTDAIWYPGGTWGTWEQTEMLTAQALQPEPYQSMVERLAEDIERAESHRRAQGDWEQRGTKLALFPTPASAGIEVEITYTAHHSVSDDGLEYATVPDEHLNAIVGLTIAEHLQAKAIQRADQTSYAEGVTRVTKGHMPENLSAQVSRLRREALAEIGA